jgi:hypothetical protein
MLKKLPPHKMVVPSLFALLVGAAGLQGCATNLVASGDQGAGAFTEGAPYRLPINTFKVDVSWQISSCKIIPSDDPDAIRIEIGFKQLAEVTSEFAEGEALVIDYQKMTGPFKTGKLGLDYWTVGEGKLARPTMLVKSINGEIEGNEGKAIQEAASVMRSAANLALTASGVPPLPAGSSGGGSSGNRGSVGCNEKIQNAIQTIELNGKALKKIAKEYDDLALQVSLISGRVVGAKLTDEDDRRLGEVQTAMDQLAKEKEGLEKLTGNLKAFLTYKESYSLAEFTEPVNWVNPVLKLTKELLPEKGKVAELALEAVDFDAQWCADADSADECKEIRSSIVKQADSSKIVVTLDARGIGNTGFTPSFNRMTPQQLKAASFNGFVFREPLPANIKIAGSDGEVISELPTTVPQYGRVRVLPLRSGFGEKNELSADFALNGMPTKVSYNAHQAGGVAIFASAASILDQANTIADRMAANNLAKDQQAKDAALESIKDKIALLTEQQKLDTLTRGPNTEIEGREAELAKLRFEVERMELLAKLGRTTN